MLAEIESLKEELGNVIRAKSQADKQLEMLKREQMTFTNVSFRMNRYFEQKYYNFINIEIP